MIYFALYLQADWLTFSALTSTLHRDVSRCKHTDKHTFPAPLRYKYISSIIDHCVYLTALSWQKPSSICKRNVHFNASVINAQAQPYQSGILLSLVHWSATSGAQHGVIKAIRKKNQNTTVHIRCRCNVALLALFHQATLGFLV